jgi:hypothetical protein
MRAAFEYKEYAIGQLKYLKRKGCGHQPWNTGRKAFGFGIVLRQSRSALLVDLLSQGLERDIDNLFDGGSGRIVAGAGDIGDDPRIPRSFAVAEVWMTVRQAGRRFVTNTGGGTMIGKSAGYDGILRVGGKRGGKRESHERGQDCPI